MKISLPLAHKNKNSGETTFKSMEKKVFFLLQSKKTEVEHEPVIRKRIICIK